VGGAHARLRTVPAHKTFAQGTLPVVTKVGVAWEVWSDEEWRAVAAENNGTPEWSAPPLSLDAPHTTLPPKDDGQSQSDTTMTASRAAAMKGELKGSDAESTSRCSVGDRLDGQFRTTGAPAWEHGLGSSPTVEEPLADYAHKRDGRSLGRARRAGTQLPVASWACCSKMQPRRRRTATTRRQWRS